MLNIEIIKLNEYWSWLALRKGMNMYIKIYFKFDSDDYNIPSRAEEQLNFMEKDWYIAHLYLNL